MIAAFCILYLVCNTTEKMFYIRMWIIQKKYLFQLRASSFCCVY